MKDIRCDLNKKTIVLIYDANKTDVPTLQKAFAKIGKPATTAPIEGCEIPRKEQKVAPVDAHSGASTKKSH